LPGLRRNWKESFKTVRFQKGHRKKPVVQYRQGKETELLIELQKAKISDSELFILKIETEVYYGDFRNEGTPEGIRFR
jgi:hypothetical protein